MLLGVISMTIGSSFLGVGTLMFVKLFEALDIGEEIFVDCSTEVALFLFQLLLGLQRSA